jgi:hypothetical protein
VENLRRDLSLIINLSFSEKTLELLPAFGVYLIAANKSVDGKDVAGSLRNFNERTMAGYSEIPSF